MLFLFRAPSTTDIYTLSLHDALPIYVGLRDRLPLADRQRGVLVGALGERRLDEEMARHLPHGGEHGRVAEAPRLDLDRKSTRLNSSHRTISYAVFCLKKKNKHEVQVI